MKNNHRPSRLVAVSFFAHQSTCCPAVWLPSLIQIQLNVTEKLILSGDDDDQHDGAGRGVSGKRWRVALSIGPNERERRILFGVCSP